MRTQEINGVLGSFVDKQFDLKKILIQADNPLKELKKIWFSINPLTREKICTRTDNKFIKI